ncbi:MAG: hypothetical protein R3B96_15025 [Pirellulaceae bacterium]|nr:hypothetical protein [Planctomycetales bacterium]
MRHFKLPLIVTAIVFVLMIVASIAAFVWLGSQKIPDRQLAERAGLLGSGIATLGMFVIAPFWLWGAAMLGKERRAKAARKVNQR